MPDLIKAATHRGTPCWRPWSAHAQQQHTTRSPAHQAALRCPATGVRASACLGCREGELDIVTGETLSWSAEAKAASVDGLCCTAGGAVPGATLFNAVSATPALALCTEAPHAVRAAHPRCNNVDSKLLSTLGEEPLLLRAASRVASSHSQCGNVCAHPRMMCRCSPAMAAAHALSPAHSGGG